MLFLNDYWKTAQFNFQLLVGYDGGSVKKHMLCYADSPRVGIGS